MDAKSRRKEILNIIKYNMEPVSGSSLAKKLNVSRQIIVQDIALLRAENNDIISTHKGYILNGKNTFKRVFKVYHNDDEIVDELNTIVDLGARVIDVFVNHKVYGKLTAKLDVSSRRDVLNLVDGIKKGKSTPLKNTTSNYHYHTVESESEEILDLVEKALKEKNYLIEKTAE
ncbi:transcription repressor NadR [Anaerofustis stercorihominis]|uniref:transcription repressor NadR n=1 Tax=Anaerofustis stercorihominis TaxID=214853 RepID=UPI001106E3B0|nr:transcription repressor NadR [Anaerofustis stercorihominis]